VGELSNCRELPTYSECGGRVGQDQLSLSLSFLLPNTRLAAPLCEKEKKKGKNRKRKGYYKPMTVVCQCRNKNPRDHSVVQISGFGRPVHNLTRRSLRRCEKDVFRYSNNHTCAMLELQKVSSLPAVLPSRPGRHECIDSHYFVIGRAKAPHYFNPKPSLPVTAPHSFSSSFLRLPYA
jgi:hypothetical protein